MLHAYKKKFYGINKFCFYSSVLITIAFVHQSPGDLLTGRSHWLTGTHLNEVHWFMYRKVSKLQDAYWQKRHLWDFSTFFFFAIYILMHQISVFYEEKYFHLLTSHLLTCGIYINFDGDLGNWIFFSKLSMTKS